MWNLLKSLLQIGQQSQTPPKYAKLSHMSHPQMACLYVVWFVPLHCEAVRQPADFGTHPIARSFFCHLFGDLRAAIVPFRSFQRSRRKLHELQSIFSAQSEVRVQKTRRDRNRTRGITWIETKTNLFVLACRYEIVMWLLTNWSATSKSGPTWVCEVSSVDISFFPT